MPAFGWPTSVFGLAAPPAPDAAPAGGVVGVVVADLFPGVSFTLGFVTPCAGPVVPSVFGVAAVPAPVAGPAGAVAGVVVADLFSGPGFVPGFIRPGVNPLAPFGNAAPPFMPGRVLSAGSVVGATFVCKVVGVVPFRAGGAPAVPAGAE